MHNHRQPIYHRSVCASTYHWSPLASSFLIPTDTLGIPDFLKILGAARLAGRLDSRTLHACSHSVCSDLLFDDMVRGISDPRQIRGEPRVQYGDELAEIDPPAADSVS